MKLMKYVKEKTYDFELGCLPLIIKIILVVAALWLMDFACQKIGSGYTGSQWY